MSLKGNLKEIDGPLHWTASDCQTKQNWGSVLSQTRATPISRPPFFSLQTKKIKKTVRRPEYSELFYFNCSLLCMSVTKFAFLLLKSARATFHTYYLLLTLTTCSSPCSSSFLHIKRRRQNHWTARLNYWVTDVSLWVSLNKILTPLSLITDFWPLALILYKPLDSSRKGDSSWGMSLLYSPLGQLRIKARFLFPTNSVSVFFYLSLVGRESQDLGQQHVF